MEYTKLGSTEIEVSGICVGCMSFGKAGTMHDWTLDEGATAGPGSRPWRTTITCSTGRTSGS